jgi:protein phosphatase
VADARIASGARLVVTPDPSSCGATDVGLQRANNEDRFHVSDDASVLAVADGLGGLPAGEVASSIAVSAAVAVLDGRSGQCADEVVAMEMLGDVFRSANRAIQADAAHEPAHRGMATTLVVALIAGSTMYLSHVGDVRGYRLSKRGLERLTDDHTTAWELVEAGVLTEQEARIHPFRNALTQVLGLHERADPSFRAVPLSPGDVVLLCSDGLWEPVDAGAIAAVLAMPGADVRSRTLKLLELAMAAGAPDNVTAVVYQHS